MATRIRFTTRELDDQKAEERLAVKRREQAAIRQKMELIFSFCPNYVLVENIDEMENMPFVSVLLDIQITGLLRLIEKYMKLHDGGIYKLTFTLNAYLSAIIETVSYWGGDVLKIYGDRCLNMWKLQPEETLYEALHSVVMCACIIKNVLRNFDTFIPHKMDLKMSIACGNIYGTCHGSTNKLLIFRGAPMEAIYKLASVVKPGEILISAKAWAYMIPDRYHVEVVSDTIVKLLNGNIAYRSNEHDINEAFSVKELEVRELIDGHLEFMRVLHNNHQNNPTETSIKLTHAFMRKILPRQAVKEALRVCDLSEIRSFVYHTVQRHIDKHQPVEYLTAMSTVTSQMICIKPNTIESMSDGFIKFVYNEVSKSIQGTTAFIHLFEVTTEIKIIVMRGIEGIRQDIESKRALETGYKMNRHFQDIPGIDNTSVGIFQGFLYCGVVGHPFRREYVALGSVLNRGFKLMERHKGKVICDYKTFKFSKVSSYFFRCLQKRRCNVGFDTGQLLEYSEVGMEIRNERNPEDDIYELFGREKELNIMLEVLQSHASGSQGVILEGAQNIGKTFMLHCIINRLANSKNFSVVSLVLHKSFHAPYASMRHVYDQFYKINSEAYKDMPDFYKFPTELMDRHQHAYDDGYDMPMCYRMFKHLKDMIDFGSDRVPVIVIKYIHYIDAQSWGVLEKLLEACKLRLFASADFSIGICKVKDRMQANDHLKWIHMTPMSDYWINTIACNKIGVGALERRISQIVTSICKGNPGHVQCCLTYLIDCQQYIMDYIPKSELTPEFVPIHHEILATMPNEITVMVSSSYDVFDDELTDKCNLVSITKEFYYSLSSFDQAVLQAASILGTLFSRDLLHIALYSPDKDELLKSIKTMFREHVFECGSVFVHGNAIPCAKYSCRCYMTYKEESAIPKNERYLHCKLLHFKHETLRVITYDMIPSNKKKDLHLLCTEVLENSSHCCPMCLRDPLNGFVAVPKYKDTVDYCSGNDLQMTECSPESTEHIKDCVRRKLCFVHEKVRFGCTYAYPIRLPFDQTRCTCLDMLLFVYEKLIYHSNCAKHLGKQILYYSVYGGLLIMSDDVMLGMATLREALELCMVNMNSPKCEISPNYRKFNVGRISMVIASALIQLRKVSPAKTQMALAMRQYNVPSVAFRYQHFQCFLKKSYLVNSRCRHKQFMKKSWMRWEIGMCFIVCARIYSTEGKLAMAKSCAKYSIWLLSQMNERIPMLFEMYCNVMEFYRYGSDKHICEKLQKYVTKEVLLNYCNNRAYYGKHLMMLMTVDFELRVTSGKFQPAITICYRIIDTTLKLYVYATNYDVLIWISLLFTYTMRFKEFIDLMKLFYNNIPETAQIWYYSNALEVTLLTGYSFLTIDSLMREIHGCLTSTDVIQKDWQKNYLLSLTHLHLMKAESYIAADKYKPMCTFNVNNVNRPIVFRILLNIVEAGIFDMWYRIKNSLSSSTLQVTLDEHFKLAKHAVKLMPVFYPRLHCLLAWKHKLRGEKRKAKSNLRQAEKYSRKQGNTYFYCFVRKLRNYWGGSSYLANYKTRIFVELEDVKYFNEDQWIQVLLPYPTLS